MSTSQGTPSNKLSWYKSLSAKIARQTRMYEEAARLAENSEYAVKIKLSEKESTQAQFAEMLAEAKKASDRRKAKKVRPKAQKTVDNND